MNSEGSLRFMKKVTRIGWHWNWILGWLFSLQVSSIQLCIFLLTGFGDHILIFQADKQLIRHILIIISIVVGSSRFWLFTPAQQCIGIFQSASWWQFCVSPIRCQNLPQPPAIFFRSPALWAALQFTPALQVGYKISPPRALLATTI